MYFSELGFSPEQRDRVIRKLLLHTKNVDAAKRERAILVLGYIGQTNHELLIKALLPGLIDKEVGPTKPFTVNHLNLAAIKFGGCTIFERY